MSMEIKKILNRILVVTLSLPFAFVVFSPLLLLYGLFLLSHLEGRAKLKRYYLNALGILKLIIASVRFTDTEIRSSARRDLLEKCKSYWNGKN
mgnify:FL=1|jgi:hypothetical protein